MKIHQLAAALQVLRKAIAEGIPRGAAAVLLSLMASCCALLVNLSERLRTFEDPRIAACHGALIEDLSRYTQREQLHTMIRLESTAAHLLDDVELTALRQWRAAPAEQLDLARAPQLISGRAHYQNTVDFASSWLGLNYHEAATRLANAHLVIARRHVDGREIPARHSELAQLFMQAAEVEPKRVIAAARALEKFEPADTVHDGLPLPATAAAPDGALLESHVAAALREPNRTVSKKRVSALINDYRDKHRECEPTPTGMFFRGKRGTAERWEILADGEQAEMMHSLSNQADNPRTEAGKAARACSGGKPCPDPFTSDQPAPEWSGIDAEPINEGDLSAGAQQNQNFVDPALFVDAGLAGDGDVSPAQRRLNALLAALNRKTADQGKTIAPQVAIHLRADQLSDLKDPEHLIGTTATGAKLDAATTGKLICQGELYRVVFGPDGQPLDLGRSQRFFSDAIKKAAFARDRGCIVPGCTAPPEMIEYHHDDWWSRGGPTSIRNASCLCRRHHLAIHAGLLTLVKINGLAHILLPKHVDPSQTPARNQLFADA